MPVFLSPGSSFSIRSLFVFSHDSDTSSLFTSGCALAPFRREECSLFDVNLVVSRPSFSVHELRDIVISPWRPAFLPPYFRWDTSRGSSPRQAVFGRRPSHGNTYRKSQQPCYWSSRVYDSFRSLNIFEKRIEICLSSVVEIFSSPFFLSALLFL